jgi:hypothetical protein
MNDQTDLLEGALRELEHLLGESVDDRDPGWAARADRALAGLEQGIRQHDRDLDPPDGQVVEVDRPAIPSPTLQRRLRALHEELKPLHEEAMALRIRLRAVPEAGPDRRSLRERASRLIQALERFEHEEAGIVQESVNLDIGAPD